MISGLHRAQLLRQAVPNAKDEVLRAERQCDQVELDYRSLIEASHAYLADCQRRLRVAEMVERRASTGVVCRPVDPAPWLQPPPAPTLLDCRDRITLDAGRVSDD